MGVRCPATTILIVDRDATVRRVLGRVLLREGHRVLEAGDAGRALQLAEQHHPRLALLDLCLHGGGGADLADRLHARAGGVPLILITGYPPLGEPVDPVPARPYLRVLPKPFDLNELRRAVHAALSEAAMQQPNSSPVSAPAPAVAPPPGNGQPPAHVAPAAAPDLHAHHSTTERVKSAVVVVLALVALAGFFLYVVGVPVPGLSAAAEGRTVQKPAPARIEVLSRPGEPPTVRVPEDVRRSLGLRDRAGNDRLATAREPTEARPLVLSGSTALDPARLVRIRARFAPADVVEIGQVDDFSGGATARRELRSGDAVRKGDLLGVFYSVDVGNKKNDLVDALLQMKLDKELLDASQRAYDKGVIPLLDLLAAKKNVEGDYNTIERAENTLRAWTVPEADIDAVREEARKINEAGGQRDRDPEHLKQQLRRWAKVELRAPDDGTIVECNVTPHETVVDNTVNLFQIARPERIQISANVPEDLAPALQALLDGGRGRWVIHTAGAPPEGIAGAISDISYVIDVNQHSAVAKGYVPSPGKVLRGGQYMTATVQMPPPRDVVEIPADALADDGKQAVVFVQADPNRPGVYDMRRVEVVQRLEKSVLVRSRLFDARGEPVDELPPTPQEKEDGLLPRHVLKPGDRVITAGVLEIKKELEDHQPEGGR
jgi:cobalt-zinc-cadmium efflux system membrane fusion protein